MRRLGLVCVVGALGLMAVITHARTPVWADDYTLWQDAAEKAPLRPRPRINYGRAAGRLGDYELARQQFVAAFHLAQDPRRSTYQRIFSQAVSQANLAHLLARHGEIDAAIALVDAALVLAPTLPQARYNRSALLAMKGDCLGSYEDFQVAREGMPGLELPPCHE